MAVPVGAGNLARGQRVALSITLDPTPLIMARDLHSFGQDIKSLKEPLKRSIQQVMAPSFRKNFDVGGRPAWRPLSDYTVSVKGHSRPLIRSGTLRNVAQQLNIWTIQGPQGRAFISGLPERAWYGTIHQAGSVGARQALSMDPVALANPVGETPARPFLVVQPEDVQNIQKVFAKWANERAARRRL